MYKLRFNLGAGKNFLKWKLTYPNGDVAYFEPSEVQFTCDNAKLVNQKSAATKIFEGANKTVCAWIKADYISITNMDLPPYVMHRVSYNPRVTPNWVYAELNADGQTFRRLITVGREIFNY